MQPLPTWCIRLPDPDMTEPGSVTADPGSPGGQKRQDRRTSLRQKVVKQPRSPGFTLSGAAHPLGLLEVVP